jgi:hypothetical protein
MQPLHGRADLFANCCTQDRVASIEALRHNYPARDVIRTQQLGRCDSEHAKAEPRRLAADEVAIAAFKPGASTRSIIIKALKAASLRGSQLRPHIGAMHLDLTDEETAALTKELHDIVESDRYPFSLRIGTLRGILAKLRPEPVRKPVPPLKHYEPPRFIRHRG